MQVGFEPYKIPDDDTAAERAKEFCKVRKLTPKDVKIVRRDGFVRVVVIRRGARIAV